MVSGPGQSAQCFAWCTKLFKRAAVSAVKCLNEQDRLWPIICSWWGCHLDDGHAETALPHDEPLRIRDSETKNLGVADTSQRVQYSKTRYIFGILRSCVLRVPVLCMHSIRCFTDESSLAISRLTQCGSCRRVLR